MTFFRPLKGLCALVFFLSYSMSTNAQMTLTGGTKTDTLQIISPIDSIFTLSQGDTIYAEASAIVGNNSQNWQFTNQGVLSAGTVSSGSGLKLDSRDPGMAIVYNEDSIASVWPQGNGPSGVQFQNGGQVYNRAGGWIEGYDGVHTDHASILVENSGTIYGNHGGGSTIYSGEGALVTNLAGGLIKGTNYGISANGNDRNVEIRNYGTIQSSNQAIYLYDGTTYTLYNAPGAIITSGGGNTISLSGSKGYMLNEGIIEASQSGFHVNNDGGGNVYVNTDSILADNGYAIVTEADDRGNMIYNFGVLTGSKGSIWIKGDSTVLILGQTTYLPQINRYVTGPGSRLNGDVVSDGLHNKLLLTDTGSEDNALNGFQSLFMNGTAWALKTPLKLADSLIVRNGNLTLTDSITLTNTHAAVAVQSGGTLTLADSVKITLPDSAVFHIEAGGLLNIFHTRDTTGNYLIIPDSTILEGTVQFDSLLVINKSLTLAGATLNLHPGADTIRVNGIVDLTAGNNRINVPTFELNTPYTILIATGGITGDASHFAEVLSAGVPLSTCDYEIIVAADTIKLLFKDGSVTITEQPVGDTVYEGKPYTFQVKATGDNLTYNWYKDGVLIPDENTNSLTIRNVSPSDEGIYHAEVSNGCRTAVSDPAILEVCVPVPPDPTGVSPAGEAVLEVYPNPVEDWLSIDNGSLPISNVTVFSITGHTVYQARPESPTHTVNVSGWVAGIYLVKITTADGHTLIKKVIRK